MPINYVKPQGSSDQPNEGQPAGGQSGAGLSLSKVALTKAAPAVSLSKRGGAQGRLRVNLRWSANAGAPARGLFKRLMSQPIDLDLGCLYEFADGSKGVVQAVGNSFRDKHSTGSGPIVWLDKDDRSGNSADGENLFIDLGRLSDIRRILVFAFIYRGVPNWAAADGVVTLFPSAGPQIEILLDEHDSRCQTVAIALLENKNNDLVINREVRYVQGNQETLDRTYGWGMNWSPARK